MTQLVRFKDWIIDREQINFVEIKFEGERPSCEFDEKLHLLTVHMKGGKMFQAECMDLYDARKELDFLTSQIDPEIVGDRFDHYIIKQIYFARDSAQRLAREVEKLMKSYSKVKKQLSKRDK